MLNAWRDQYLPDNRLYDLIYRLDDSFRTGRYSRYGGNFRCNLHGLRHEGSDRRRLNDDNHIVRVMEDGHVEVFGTPWSGKTPCYKNEHYPAGAFTEIVRSAENRITRKKVLEAYALLYSSSSGFKADPAMADGLNASYEKIIKATPCVTLECRPDADAARVSSETLLAL